MLFLVWCNYLRFFVIFVIILEKLLFLWFIGCLVIVSNVVFGIGVGLGIINISLLFIFCFFVMFNLNDVYVYLYRSML